MVKCTLGSLCYLRLKQVEAVALSTPTDRGPGGSVVQCSARDLKVASSILAHGSFLVRGAALLLILAELYGL